MRLPSEEDLLGAWEQGTAQHPLDRALTLLRTSWPERSRADLARLPLGARDSLLLLMRERLFGRELRAVGDCPRCGVSLEIPATTFGLRAPDLERPPDGPPVELELDGEGISIRYRLLDSDDLAAVLECHDGQEARRVLLERVVVEARRDGREIAAADLAPELVAELEERLGQADPQAETLLNLTCPGCGAAWQAPLDVTVFVWSDIDRWARRLLGTVDTLARVYGWREADVLALPPRRRRLYLEMATS